MAMPKSVTKVTKDGITFVNSVDRVNYTIVELTRAALRDTAKLIRKRMIQKLKKIPGMKKHRRPYRSTQYWVRRWESDLVIGFKHNTWYGVDQELGTRGQKKLGILRSTVYENIDEIEKIQAQYLSAIEDERRAAELIDENEDKNQGDDA